MTEQEIFTRLVPLVQEVTGARDGQVHMDSGLVEDLGSESLDLLDLSFLIEETFAVTLEANEFERQVRAQLDGEFDRDGLLTAEAVAALQRLLPEVPPEKLQPGLPKVALPQVLTVAVFVHLIERKLNEKEALA